MRLDFERYGIWLLLLALFFGFYFQLGSVPLFDLDEGAFSEATREMLLSGNYLTTYLNGELRFDKPILIYWLQALSVSIVGVNELGFRLPSALAATLWVVVLYRFATIYFDRSTALMAALMLATTLQITIIAKAAIADALLNLWMASAMFVLYRYYDTRQSRWLYATFLSIALGVLTKGPVAILVPLAVSFVFLLSRGEWRLWLKMVFHPLGILLFLAVASPWYILEYLDQGQKFIEGFFLKHNVNRFNTSLEGHSGTLFYFIPVVLIGLLPYTSLLFVAGRHIRKWFTIDLYRYLAIWFLFVFLFFSLSGTKLPHYVIYGYTPLFLIMGMHIDRVRSDTLLLLPPMLLFGALLVLPHLIVFVQPQVQNAFAKIVLQTAPDEFGIGWTLFFLFAIAVLLFLSQTARLERRLKLFGAGILMAIAVNGMIMPTYAAIQQAPIKEAALYAKAHDLDVHLWEFNMPSFIVYRGELVKRTKPKEGEIVLTKKHQMQAFEVYEVLYEKHGVVLARILSPKPEEQR
jgi:4-amino-4-deoxy-L-arabinose transferase-like glycosyltransferase